MNRTLLELYNLIIDEKASYDDYQEFVVRLLVSELGPENCLQWLKVQREGSS